MALDGTTGKEVSTRTVDARGRLTLGPELANALVLVKYRDDGVVEITKAEAVPAHEVWLYRNPKALVSVLQGIEEAKAEDFVDAPDIEGDLRMMKED
jgi:hypothetical protein